MLDNPAEHSHPVSSGAAHAIFKFSRSAGDGSTTQISQLKAPIQVILLRRGDFPQSTALRISGWIV